MKKLSLMLLLAVIACSPKKESKNTVVPTEMPPLPLYFLSGEQKMANELNGNSILVFYSPDCDHCQREAEDLKKHINAFRNYSMYFISASLPEDAKKFADTYGFSSQSNITFAIATYDDVIRIIGPMPTPTMFVYSKEKKLVKKFEGETDVEDIIPFL